MKVQYYCRKVVISMYRNFKLVAAGFSLRGTVDGLRQGRRLPKVAAEGSLIKWKIKL